MTTWREAYHAELARLGSPMGVGDAAVMSRLAKAFADREIGRSADLAPAAPAMAPRPQPALAAPRHTTAEILAGLAGSYPQQQKPAAQGRNLPPAVDDDPSGWDDIVASTNARLSFGSRKSLTPPNKTVAGIGYVEPPDDEGEDDFDWNEVLQPKGQRASAAPTAIACSQSSSESPADAATIPADDFEWDAIVSDTNKRLAR